jgi:hypothetical protein
MPIKTRLELRPRFENGDIPDQNDFWNLIASYIHQTDDGLTVYTNPIDSTFSLGIGVTTPPARLGIKAIGSDEDLISFHKPDGSTTWGIDQKPATTLNSFRGFNIYQKTTSGNASRLFISEVNDGNIGIGTFDPKSPIHIERNTPSGTTALRIKNLANSLFHYGWEFGEFNDNTIAERNGAFVLSEEPQLSTDPPIERVVVLPGGNLGVNEKVPDVKLHVTVLPTDANARVGLLPNTGIAEFGPITESVIIDGIGIQARGGTYDTSGELVVPMNKSTLNLQSLGGDVLVFGGSAFTDSQKVIVKESISASNPNQRSVNPRAGLGVGIGIIEPLDTLHVNGKIIIGNNNNTAINGAIRYDDDQHEFSGYNGTTWVSFTGEAGKWTSPANTTDKITYNAADAKVGIGVVEPFAALDVLDDTAATTGSTAARIRNTSAGTGGANDNRVGLEINATGTNPTVPWNLNQPLAKDIGLYVSGVSGQASSNFNLAAVLNGNVVIGDVVGGTSMVGTNATKVLALQDSVAPTTRIGPSSTTVGGIQIYSQSSDSSTISTFHLMNGNGTIIRLFRGLSLTTPAAAVGTTNPTYTSVEAGVINNLRTRILDLEARLQALGLLPTNFTNTSTSGNNNNTNAS